jgi:hypothetical protein
LHGQGRGAQVWFVYEPDSVPLLHVRVCEAAVVVQDAPQATELDANAVTLAPSAMVVPHGVLQGAQAPTPQFWLVYVPESTPLLQTRTCEAHVFPHVTDGVWNAVTPAPFARVPPQGSAHEQAPTVQVGLVLVPDSVPFVQVRVCEVQELPQLTVPAAKAVVLAPLAMVPPHGSVQGAQAPTVHAA